MMRKTLSAIEFDTKKQTALIAACFYEGKCFPDGWRAGARRYEKGTVRILR